VRTYPKIPINTNPASENSNGDRSIKPLNVLKQHRPCGSFDNSKPFSGGGVDEIPITKVVKADAKMYVKSDSRIEASREGAHPHLYVKRDTQGVRIKRTPCV